jgi:DNA-binding IclR family transcriptional regulator
VLGTVSKAGDVLKLFTAADPERGVSEVAQRMRLPKSSAHALLATLAETGLVRRTNTGRYHLGWRVVELHQALVSSTEFLGRLRPS